MRSAWDHVAYRVSTNGAFDPYAVEAAPVETAPIDTPSVRLTTVKTVTVKPVTEKKFSGITSYKSDPSQIVKSVEPQEKPKAGWKPLSLSTPILAAVITLTILLAVAIETLAQRSAAMGGLALSPSLDDMPEYARISYLYGPNTVAVLYSIIWSWIDLDTKRMQPWFELSKPKGATGEDSLFVDYQYDFVALVPFKSARKKHWPVFFAGTAMVIVFWLLTPLQSALMGTTAVVLTEPATINLSPVDDSIQAISPRQILPETEFNSTAFEFLLANGMDESVTLGDHPFNTPVEEQANLNSSGIFRPDNMVGYALAGRDNPTTDYSNPEILTNAFNEAHQHLFSLQVETLLINTTKFSNHTASVNYFLHGVVVSRDFAAVTECLLGVVAVFTALVLWYSRSALSNLPMNPSTLGRHVDIFRDNPELLHHFRSIDNFDDKSLLEEFRKDEFRLFYDRPSKSTRVAIQKAEQDPSKSIERRLIPQEGYYEPVKPWVLRRWSGTIFVIVLIAGIVGLCFLKQREKKLNGLYRPSENFEVLQLLENYLPTIFATLIEPVWILLNRMLCVLQPFKDLWEGKSKPSTSMDATYTSIPPQLVVWRAIKSRHFTLALVCIMALLANVLAVGLGSLFNEAAVTAKYPQVLQPVFAPRFDNSSVYDFPTRLALNTRYSGQYRPHFYVAMTNMSSGTTLPPWVSKGYYFQRHGLPDTNQSAVGDTYSLRTRGFGVNANCTPISDFKVPSNTTGLPQFQNDTAVCESYTDIVAGNLGSIRTTSNWGVVVAGEITPRWAGGVPPNVCDIPFPMAWGRTAEGGNINATIDASLVMCNPIFETAMFNLTVDPSGYVLDYQRTSDLQATLDYPESREHTDLMFAYFNRQMQFATYDWHNTSLARDWMNYLIFLSTGSRDHLDPKLPVPDSKKMAPIVEELYQLLYAVLLSLNEDIFDHSDLGESIAATRNSKEIRIFMENVSFIISVVILAMNAVVATIFYIRAVAFVLPRMPTTLGSILAYVAPSRLLEDSG
ncbi:hypothetical protein G7Z17_g5419 [Cylindrodendrum hubeiense]|uniref:Uncharacterized protein n=1 Tax=Cylindrodendrum hubeiense TaxID=595255 RepID=A0A9P5LBQ4_9HYPO|nr:hypothetical protein G7Z17_g5419 [Cylindrodendrum hubeiense]